MSKIRELNTGTLVNPTYIAGDNGINSFKLDFAAMVKSKGDSKHPVYSNSNGVLVPIDTAEWINRKEFSGNTIDDITESGWFYFNSAVNGAPIAQPGYLLSLYVSTNYAFQQFIFRRTVNTIWYRTKQAGVWNEWVCMYAEDNETTWTVPTIYESAMTISNGGFYIYGRRCYVQMRCALTADLAANTARIIGSSMPTPKSTPEAVLNCLVYNRSGHGARVMNDGNLQIIADPDHGITSGQTIAINGVYTIG